MASKSLRSSISPFRSRKSPSVATPSPTPGPARHAGAAARSATSSSSSSSRPTTPSSMPAGRPTTPSSTASARPTTPSSGRPSTAPPVGKFAAVPPISPSMAELPEFAKSKENVTVTVRFRPLNAREINKGDEIAWYADGDYIVRYEYNPSIAYGFDRVFGPATTTRHVYDVAAEHVVSGAMEGINGTVFAYGVTSSGKTHTMHGEQKSPGIIPLAVKNVFSIIQETPGREFLLRVSYLEIYNEVINDLLDPTGQNLRIREDSQGTYVEGIKEEVVLSPAHALSLIAAGEEHRHVGSNNFNLVSSRSHTIFTLTIESSPSREDEDVEDVRLSQLNLIDLAGSESSKTETTGLRRKEGSYINKSLLTLGTVIGKLTDGKASHIPYRDSKLTRLLQSSLSGHGRISLICTVTPASSNSEETHNTLKFANRSKHVEVKASQNKILDEKSLIKKYQREISCLKQEMQQLKRGMMENPFMVVSNHEDLVNLKLQLEAGQVKLQSRLEEEEEAKAALMGRIQRLTKLILVSTKNSIPSNISDTATHRRRHSFGEDELAYLPNRKREHFVDDDDFSIDSEFSEGRVDSTSMDEPLGFNKRNRKRGMLGWLKLRKSEQLSGMSPGADSESSTGSSSGSRLSQRKQVLFDVKDGRRKSISRKGDEPLPIVDPLAERTQAGELFSVTVKGRRPPPTGTTITDQMDLLREQVKMLTGEIALCTSSLKRLSEQLASHPEDMQLQEQIKKLRDEIKEKKQQLQVLEQRMVGSFEMTPYSPNNIEMSQALSQLSAQLSEKTFELEIMSADNRVLREQLQMKISENAEFQETISLLRQQVASLSDNANKRYDNETCLAKPFTDNGLVSDRVTSSKKSSDQHTVSNAQDFNSESSLMAQVLMQAAEIEKLKQELVRLAEENDGLEIHSQKLAEEASYAKELAAEAAVELRNLAEEVTRLSYQNVKLTGDVAALKELMASNCQSRNQYDVKQESSILRTEEFSENMDLRSFIKDLQKELSLKSQIGASLEAALIERDKREADLQLRIEDAKSREEKLENELANMWILVAKIKKNGTVSETLSEGFNEKELLTKQSGFFSSNGDYVIKLTKDKLAGNLNTDKTNMELARAAYRLKDDDLVTLNTEVLEELQSFQIEALSKICQEKVAS